MIDIANFYQMSEIPFFLILFFGGGVEHGKSVTEKRFNFFNKNIRLMHLRQNSNPCLLYQLIEQFDLNQFCHSNYENFYWLHWLTVETHGCFLM